MAESEIIKAGWQPLAGLLTHILEQVGNDLPGVLSSTITVQHDDGSLEVLAATGVGMSFIEAQLRLGGPVMHAIERDETVIAERLWADERWPELTREAVARLEPDATSVWSQLVGAAALPGAWHDGTVVLACTLERPAGADVVAVLGRYEPLASAALLVAVASSQEGTRRMLGLVRSRAAIDQAKGAVMGALRCDADQAWDTLRRASQEFNIKLRELAVALVEYLGDAPAEQPGDGCPISPDDATRDIAALVWRALSHAGAQRRAPAERGRDSAGATAQ